MNNLQNYADIIRHTKGEKPDGGKYEETLKILLESGNSSLNGSRTTTKRKDSRESHLKCLLEDKRRDGKKSRKVNAGRNTSKKTTSYENEKECVWIKSKPRTLKKVKQQSVLKIEDKTDKLSKVSNPESNHTILKSIFAIPKDNLKRTESNQTNRLSQKPSGKLSLFTKPSEVKRTISDYRKIHINEILKGHAQKLQTNPSKTNQEDNSIQGVNELLQKIKNLSKNDGNASGGDDCKKDAKGKPDSDKQNDKKEEKSGNKPPKESKSVKEINFGDEKQLIVQMCLSGPQSNVLEKSLRELGPDEQDLIPQNDDNTTTSLADRYYAKKKEEEAKMLSDGEDKKSKMGESGLLDLKKLEDPRLLSEVIDREILNVQIGRQLSNNRDSGSRQNDGSSEHLFRTRATRSTELRDLVSQAIKEHKIFCIFDSHWYIARPVREELLSRGWLEVIPDRRLIPRRRPPPMGPTYDRDKIGFFDRNNCNTIEAIFTAKEIFADELQETVSKSSSFRTAMEKPKTLATSAPYPPKKSSDESLVEVTSQFRIIPPSNTDKKKNNADIREFVTRCQTMVDDVKTKKGKDKDKKEKPAKKDKSKEGNDGEKNDDGNLNKMSVPTPLTASLQAILDTINDNKKTILQATTELKKLEGKIGMNGMLGSPSNLPAIESREDIEKKSENEDRGGKTFYSETEAKMISKIIQSANTRIHFMWLSIKPAIHLKCFNYSPEIVNKFQKTTFCTKIGLWNHLNNIQWYAHEVHFPAKSPRMYNTGEADDLQAFFKDFQLTACIGILKWLSDTFFDRGIKGVQTKKGKVPLKAFEFAIKQCEKYIRFRDNDDLSIIDEPKVLQQEWNTFLQWFYIITNDQGKVQESSSAQLMVVYTKAVETLKAMKRHWPEIDIDGRLNIWIMKPYCASCGRGIFMTNNVYYISQHSKYIVQKYIERPLLIYNTKFDIRQWFLVTKLTPLEVWMYKECYLRFCTQPFALRNLHESVHLSNNSVQRKYVSVRDPSLPDQNMWDSTTFQIYLKTIGHPTAWQDIIYPGMRDAIVSTMLAAQDTFDGPRRSWFEVYGADFMISANVKDGPWLIEINENPAMDPSTKVTARLCPQMLRDVIKVVVDKRSNKNACTGQWELVYRQNYSPSFGSADLDVKGKKIVRIQPVKINPNIPVQHSLQNPLKLEMDSKRYEIVKSLGSGKSSKGDGSDSFPILVARPVDKEKTKGSDRESDSLKRADLMVRKMKKDDFGDEKWKAQQQEKVIEKEKLLSMVMSLIEKRKEKPKELSSASFLSRTKRDDDIRDRLSAQTSRTDKRSEGSQQPKSSDLLSDFKYSKYYRV